MVTLSDFSLQLPRYVMPQADLRRWTMLRHLASREEGEGYERLFERYAVKPGLIDQRYSECPDILSFEFQGPLYAVDPRLPQGADIGQRHAFFAARAREVFETFYAEGVDPPDHLVHVTCTGYLAPSPAQLLVAGRGWGDRTAVTHAYHMGCYASLPAVRIAEGLVAARSEKEFCVDIVHTEMCGLHFDPSDHSPEQIVVQSLFADGYVRYRVARVGKGLRLVALRETLLADSSQDMTWSPEPWGFRMTLSREVPAKIRAALPSVLRFLASDAGVDPGELKRAALFAVHPGGPKIIDEVEGALELSPEQVEASRTILRERGNMSSATLPHVWERILRGPPTQGTPVVSLAFGPGLTVFAAVFRVQL